MDAEQTSHYPQNSVGRLMTERVPTIRPDATVGDVENLLLQKADDFETINYIYVVGKDNKLKGVTSIKDVFRHPKTTPIRDIIVENAISTRAHSDQEQAAILALRHNIKAIPVVDKDDRFLGVVSSDTILNIMHSEAVEDFLKSAGVETFDRDARNIIKASTLTHIQKRLPWLILGLMGGLAAAWIVNIFEGALAERLLFAAFIPTIVYMADAVGTQAQTIFIRSIALDHRLNVQKYVLRELRVSLLLGLVLATLIFLVSVVWLNSMLIGTVLFLSLFTTTLAASGVAVFLPWLFSKLRYDPAIASGPFATIVRDLSSLLIYFGIISIAVAFFGL